MMVSKQMEKRTDKKYNEKMNDNKLKMRNIKKTSVVFGICVMAMILSSCGGQRERAKDIPTEAEALSAVTDEVGIKDAKVLDVRDVRNEGKDYYGIDAVYTIGCDRLDEFTLLWSWSLDTLFTGRYYYRWITDYSDLVLEDYLKEHPLPVGVSYSESPYARSNYGAQRFFGEREKQIWFEFTSDEEFEEYLDCLKPWLDEWLSYERQYLSAGKDPVIQVFANRPQDETMDYSIQVYRTFGYDKDSFHRLGEDGETYKWSSFKKAMEAGYKARKDLVMK